MKFEDLQSFVNNLCIDDATILIKMLDDVINDNSATSKLIKRERNEMICPHCGSKLFYRNGHTKSGRQKYICRNEKCKKSFSDTSNTVVFKGRKKYETWLEFLKMELLGASLKQESEELRISKSTCFYWRQKLHEAVSKIMDKITLSGRIQIDGKYFNINLKGTKPDKMTRASKRRGHSGNSTRGITNHKICVMSAVDENDNLFFQITGLGPESEDKCDKIKHRFNDCTILISDKKAALINLAKEIGAESQSVKSSEHVNKQLYDINTINNIHRNVDDYINSFSGVSTRHLQGYLDFFTFRRILCMEFSDGVEMRKEGYNRSIPTPVTLFNLDTHKKKMPIDLFKAYGDYKFGIFRDGKPDGWDDTYIN